MGGGGGGGCVRAVKIQTCRGGPRACSPGKILGFWGCLGLHFVHFHGGERECITK